MYKKAIGIKEGKIQYFPLIDITKLLCAFLVVLIHCVEVENGHPIGIFLVKCFAGQAVPFFMIVSAFFVSEKITVQLKLTDIIKICFKNWLWIYGVWSVLWLPSYISFYHTRYPETTTTYRFLIIIRRIVFAGQGVYWYLLILAEAVFVMWLFIHFRQEKIFYVLAFIGFILGILYDANVTFLGMDVMHRIVYSIFSWSNNVFMKGIPYVALGYFLRKRKDQLQVETSKLVITYVAANMGMVLLYLLGKEQWLCLYPIQACCLFLMACQPIRREISESFSLTCRNMSSAIYFLHTVFIYGFIDPVFGVDSPIILKFFVSVILSVVVLYVVKKMKVRPVEWLLCVK